MLTDESRERRHAEIIKGRLRLPATCTLPLDLLLAIMASNEFPCDGCNDDREVCLGRERKTRG